MATCLAADEGELMVHSDHLLVASQRNRVPNPDDLPTFATSNWFMQSDGVRCWLRSGNGDHHPATRLELWDGPPKDVTDAEEVGQSSLDIDTGLGEIRFTNDDSMGGWLAVTPPESGRYLIRAYRWGKGQIAAEPEASFVHGVERWLVQIWPTGSSI